MKNRKREIILCILILAGAGIALWYVFRSVETGKQAEIQDLFSLVPDDSYAVIQINKVPLFNHLSGSETPAFDLLRDNVSTVFNHILKSHPETPLSLLSYHPMGDLLFLKMSEKQVAILQGKTIPYLFPSFSPQVTHKYGLEFYFYPDIDNRFFGYFYKDGVWVGSYSRKLLEKAAQLSFSEKNELDWNELRTHTDPKAILNLFLDGYITDIDIITEDSLLWNSKGGWLSADVILSENVCIFSTLPVILEPWEAGSIQTPITVHGKWEEWFSGKDYLLEVHPESEGIYCTLCLPVNSVH